MLKPVAYSHTTASQTHTHTEGMERNQERNYTIVEVPNSHMKSINVRTDVKYTALLEGCRLTATASLVVGPGN